MKRRRETKSDNNLPLRADVVNGALSVTIGEETLAFAFEHSESNHEDNHPMLFLKVINPREFANDVCYVMNLESDDGSTPLTRFLDQMMEKAVELGSLAVDFGDEED